VIEPPIPREAFLPDEFRELGFPDPEGEFPRLPEAAPLLSPEAVPCFLCPVPFPKPRSIVPKASVILEPSTAVTFPKISFFAEEEPESVEAAWDVSPAVGCAAADVCWEHAVSPRVQSARKMDTGRPSLILFIFYSPFHLFLPIPYWINLTAG
jgi:hypothetical protein